MEGPIGGAHLPFTLHRTSVHALRASAAMDSNHVFIGRTCTPAVLVQFGGQRMGDVSQTIGVNET